MNYTEILFKVIPEDEMESVLQSPICELDREFLGFVEVYGSVLNFVPKHFTIVDLGCYVAAQAYLFKDYEKYIGVDVCGLERFTPENACHYQITIQEYVEKHTNDLDLDTTFAICSYVPDSNAVQVAREKFKNILVFYPAGDEHPKVDKVHIEKNRKFMVKIFLRRNEQWEYLSTGKKAQEQRSVKNTEKKAVMNGIKPVRRPRKKNGNRSYRRDGNVGRENNE